MIVSNVTKVAGSAYGGGQNAYGGGLYITGDTTVRNCLIAANDANSTATSGKTPRGDASYVAGGTVLFESCTVVTNHPVAHPRGGDAYTAGLGIEVAGGTVTIRNSILWGNGDDVIGTVALEYSDVEDGDNVGVDGCISADPQFIDAAGSDFRVKGFSPCANAGTNQAWMVAATDLAGSPRLSGSAVEMGAYELPPAGTLFLLK